MNKKTIVVSATLSVLIIGVIGFLIFDNSTNKKVNSLEPLKKGVVEEVLNIEDVVVEPTVVDVEFEREVTEDTSGYPYYIEDADGCITVDGEKIQKIDNGNKVTVDKETPQSSSYPSSGLSDEEIRRQFSEQIGFNVQDGSDFKIPEGGEGKYKNLW